MSYPIQSVKERTKYLTYNTSEMKGTKITNFCIRCGNHQWIIENIIWCKFTPFWSSYTKLLEVKIAFLSDFRHLTWCCLIYSCAICMICIPLESYISVHQINTHLSIEKSFATVFCWVDWKFPTYQFNSLIQSMIHIFFLNGIMKLYKKVWTWKFNVCRPKLTWKEVQKWYFNFDSLWNILVYPDCETAHIYFSKRVCKVWHSGFNEW